MHNLITPAYQSILDIFSEEKPDFLLPFFEAKTLQRLSDISQSCGTQYCKLYDYKINVSRLDHSLGVALIIWNFTKDKKQTLAGLFHDISHSVFSHVGDFLLGDAENQESSEQYTTKLLKEDPIIMSELGKLGIHLDEVDDYTKYTIADNPGPKLSADRLEYTLGTPLAFGTGTQEEIKAIYNDIILITNESKEQEIGFRNKEIGEKLGILSIENDECFFSGYSSVIAMSFLSEILRHMITSKIITPMELYTMTEKEIIKIMETGKDEKTREMWNFYSQLSQYRIERKQPGTEEYYISSKAKRRYIDPLIQSENETKRLSQLSPEFNERRDYNLKRREERIRINYHI